jgi:hypothetical protein
MPSISQRKISVPIVPVEGADKRLTSNGESFSQNGETFRVIDPAVR